MIKIFKMNQYTPVMNSVCLFKTEDHGAITLVREQPYKSRDMVVSDSGLGRLLVNIIIINID